MSSVETMKRCARSVCWNVVVVAAGVLAASTSAADPVRERGLQHTSQRREVVEAAIATTNTVAAGTGPRLVATWAPGTSSAPEGGAVPVYLVQSPPTASGTPAAVPRGCRCVFVNPAVLDGWVQAHSTGSGRMSLDTGYVLAFMLLHELGHLTKKSYGAEFANGSLSTLNVDISLAKADEEAADEFAADLLRRVANMKPASRESIEANWVVNELFKLSWNMQAYRSLDEFGAVLTGKPSVFFDQNLTHPNLAWRVLRSNYLISQTAATKELLEAFEEARQRGMNPQPLYRKE